LLHIYTIYRPSVRMSTLMWFALVRVLIRNSIVFKYMVTVTNSYASRNLKRLLPYCVHL